MNLNLARENRNEIIDNIQERKNLDYCVIYEVLSHMKLL